MILSHEIVEIVTGLDLFLIIFICTFRCGEKGLKYFNIYALWKVRDEIKC